MRTSLTQPPSRRGGFSLIEVVLALGILAFAFVALIGLIPAGLNTMDNAVDSTVKAQILQEVANMARQASFADLQNDSLNLEAGKDSKHADWEAADYYFDDQGQRMKGSLATQKSQYVYKAAVTSKTDFEVPTTLTINPSRNMVLVRVYVTRRSAPNKLHSYTFTVANNGLTDVLTNLP